MPVGSSVRSVQCTIEAGDQDATADCIMRGEVTQTSLTGRGLTYKKGDPSLRKFIRIR